VIEKTAKTGIATTNDEWAVILAGGDGTRLKSLTRQITGEPESPEVEYGWIEPTDRLPGSRRVFGVRRFWEKPNQLLAQVLTLRGCLWNSFVMVSSVKALLETIASALPDLHSSFSSIQPIFTSSAEPNAVERLYAQLEEVNFSHQVMALQPQRLAVLRVSGVRWNDLGEPKRVLASLNMAGIRPRWANAVMPQVA
jgi:mannose-1-phosphate guanylyltransferase